MANRKLNKDSKLGRWLEAVLEYMPEVDAEVTAEDVLQKKCCVVIKHKTSADGRVYANVVDVLSVPLF